MNSITIDIGNSRTKVDYWDNDGILSRESYDSIPFDWLKREVDTRTIEGIIVSSVKDKADELIDILREKTGCDFIINFNKEEIIKYGDQIRYEGNVGPDRIAAFLGAKAQLGNSPMLIVDAGTAITYDISDREGNFCGGNISLGKKGRLKVLEEATRRLPLVEDEDDLKPFSFFGHDTRSAIENGVRNSLIGETLYSIKLAEQQYGIKWVVFTGGDYELLYGAASHEWEKCLTDRDLVGRGLNYHLRKFYFPEEFIHTSFLQAI